jgi:ribosomal protein L9
MQIILGKVANLGNLGDIVKVKDGYARQLPDPEPQGSPCNEGSDRRIRSSPRRTQKDRR